MSRGTTKQDDDGLFDLVPGLICRTRPREVCLERGQEASALGRPVVVDDSHAGLQHLPSYVRRPIAQRFVLDEKLEERFDLRCGERRREPLKCQRDRDARRPRIRAIQTLCDNHSLW